MSKRFSLIQASGYSTYKPGQSLFGFAVMQSARIDELDLSAHLLRHVRTGAQWLHLDRPSDDNNLLAFAFPTPPPSSHSGIAHILEHVTLCGSQRFPVRDPFFKMLNRSLATFMNAWTASDHTCYPFATQNAQDYRNLRDIYTDAVFWPRLREDDFRQEGWRLENEDLNDPASPLKFKGVVYNEMKGAFSDLESVFTSKLQQEMFPGTCYAYESGGDPAHIPSLTHQQLVEYHRRHYHPTAARILSYGNASLEENLKFMDEKFKGFETLALDAPSPTDTLERFTSPRRVHKTCAPDPMGDPEKQTKMIISFLANPVSDVQETFHMKLLAYLLMEGPASPLYKVLIDSNIGSEYAAGSGYDDSTATASFAIGLQGIRAADINMVENEIFRVLKETANAGFDSTRIEGAIHLLELGLRYKSANFGVGIAQGILGSWIRSADPIASLRISQKIAELKKQLAGGPLFQDLIKKYMLGNQHCLVLTMVPEPSYNEKLVLAESEQLRKLETHLTDADRSELVKMNQRLAKVQQEKEDLSILPLVHLDDVSKNVKTFNFAINDNPDFAVYLRKTPANGVAYFKTILPLQQKITDSDFFYLPILSSAITQLGVTDKPIDQFDESVRLYTGGISVSPFIGRLQQGCTPVERSLYLSSHALCQNTSKMFELFAEAITQANFKDYARLTSIISAAASSAMNSIASSGHQFAMTFAASGLGDDLEWKEVSGGLSQAYFLNQLLKLEPTVVAEKLYELAKSSITKGDGARAALICDENYTNAMQTDVQSFVSKIPHASSSSLDVGMPKHSPKITPQRVFLTCPFSTNHAALAFRADPLDLPHCAALAILARLLKSQFLHREIREKGGAYGGGASFNSLDGVFSFYSYRDPQPMKSIDTFGRAGRYMCEAKEDLQALLEAKLSLFSDLDAPVDLANEGLSQFKYGLTDHHRQQYRDGLFAVTWQDLKTIAQRYLIDGASKMRACVIGEMNREVADSLRSRGWSVGDPSGYIINP